MLFHRSSASGETFTFDNEKYMKLQNIDDKIAMLSQTISNFVSIYKKNPPNPKVKDKHNDTGMFYNALINDYSLVLHNNLSNLIIAIPFFRQILNGLPNCEKITELTQIIINDIKTKGPNYENSFKAFQSLCTVESFCIDFLTSGRFTEIFVGFIKESHFDELCGILIAFQTDQFINTMKTMNAITTLYPILNYVVGIQEAQKIIPEGNFIQIITFVFDMFQLCYTVNDLAMIDVDNYLIRQNKLLLRYPFFKITRIYESLSKQDPTYVIHPNILRLYKELYSNYGTDYEKKSDLINYIAGLSTEYSLEYVNEFKLINWFEPEICRRSPLLSGFTQIIRSIAHVKPDEITETLKLIFNEIKLPLKPNVLFSDILRLFHILIIEDNITPKQFGDEDFINLIILKSESKDLAATLLQVQELQIFFKLVFDYKRIESYSYELLDKLVQTAEINNKYSYTDYIIQLLHENYNESILTYFIKNLDIPCVPDIFYQLLSFDHILDTIRMFHAADCFSIVTEKLNLGNKWVIPFLTFINTIVMHENDHFFDEWVIIQPISSPIFKLQKESIQELVLPLIPNDPIPIPSLAPLCDEFLTTSNYNLYLLGAYALPIYTKLGFQIDKIPNIKLITNRFVRLTDFETILEKNVRCVSECLMQPVDNFPIFEFFPGHGAGWLENQDSILYTMVTFNIRFDQPSQEAYVFVNFNCFSVLIQGNHLVAPDSRIVGEIELEKWHNVMLLFTKSPNIISFYFDQQQIFSIPVSSKGILLQTIGNPHYPTIAMSVVNNVNGLTKPITENEALQYKMLETSNIKLKPMKSVGLALYNAVSTLYSSDQNIMRLFEKLGNFNEEMKDDYIRVIAMIPDICTIDYALFFKHFITVLKEMSLYCTSGWTREFALSIFWVKDINLRSEIFMSVFNDYEFWSSMPSIALIEFIDTVQTFIAQHNDILNFEILINAKIFRQLIYLIYAVQTEQLWKTMIGFYVFLLQFSNNTANKQTAQIVRSSNVWSFSNSMDLEDNPLEPFVLNFSHTSDRQSYFISCLLDYEEKTKIRIFSSRDLFSCAFIATPECTMKIISNALSRNLDNMFMEQNLVLLNCAVQRFPFEISLWNFLFSKMCDTEVNINEISGKLSIKKSFYISSIIAMIISLFKYKITEENKDFFEKATNAFKSVFTCALNYFTSNFIHCFIDFIAGGSTNIPECPVEEVKIPKSIKLNKSEVILVKSHINDVYKRWILNVNRILEERSLSISIPQKFVEFVSSFLVDLIKEQCGDWATKSPRGIAIITVYAHKSIKKSFFINYLIDIGKSSKKTIAAIADSLYYLANHENSLFEDREIVSKVIEFCKSNEKLSNLFVKFLVAIFPYIDNSLLDTAIDLITPTVSSLSMSNAILILSDIFNREQNEKVQQFIKIVVKRAKKVVNFGGNASEEQSQIENAIKTSENLENISDLLKKQISYENVEIYEKIDSDSPDIKKLIANMFRIASRNSIIVWWNLRTFYMNLNFFLKDQEKFICLKRMNSWPSISQTIKIESYRMSPFITPMHIPTSVFPSPFPIYTPSDDPPKVVVPKTSMFGNLADYDVNIELLEYLPQKLFRCSGLFYTRERDILDLFMSVYGEYSSMTNSRLIRLDTKVPCVFFTSSKSITILTGAQIVNESILRLVQVTPQAYTTLLESAFLNEYGEYGMFCGRIVLTINLSTVLYIRPTIYCCHQFCLEFFSASAGNFIIELNSNQLPVLPKLNNIDLPPLEVLMNKWIEGSLSTFDYLLGVNYYAGRSIVDLAAYPVFPRIVQSFKGTKTGPIAMRDLSLPVQITADRENSENKLKSKYAMQKFYHAENVSNPMIVSSLLVRIIPFCRYQWFINDGWDAGDRNFLSIPFHLTITAKTMYELIPDHFVTPEVFINVNKFELKNGIKFDMLLPAWCNSPTEFVEKHRSLLESARTRLELNKWLDLIFGVKQTSKDDYNVFNPLSYSENAQTLADQRALAQQQNWTELCGQVPKRVFSAPHEESKFLTKQDFVSLIFNLNPTLDVLFSINTQMCRLLVNDQVLLTSLELANATSINMSKPNGYIVVITYSISLVRSYLYVNNTIYPLSCLRISSPLKTVVHESTMVCITSCDDKIVFWSASSGSIIKMIEMSDISAMYVDNSVDAVFVASSTNISQFTLSGTLIRKFSNPSPVSCITVFGCGYGISDRNIAVGSTDGIVRLFYIDDSTNEIVDARETKISRSPIMHIVPDASGSQLNVYDITSDYTSLSC